MEERIRNIEERAEVLYGLVLVFPLFGRFSLDWCRTGVAELGGPGGPWPPQKFEWVGQGMFWPPPPNFDRWPPQNGPSVVKILAKLLLSILKCAKFSKIFACGGPIWVEVVPQVISCFFRVNSFAL